MLKKIIGLTIAALCFMNSSFAELQRFPMYGEHQLEESAMFTQLRGITVNGLTAEQARDKAYAAARQEASQYLGSEEALKSHFNAMAKTQKVQELGKRHEELSHITARSSYKRHKTPFDFVEVMGDYMHWIPGTASELTCEHRSYSELKEHAEVYTALLMVRMMILQNPQQMDSYMNTKDKVKEIFSKHYDTALKPFYEAKKAEMATEADRLNRNMKDYNCRAVLDIKENEAAYIPVLGGFFPRAKTTYCKSRKKCKFYISEAGGVLKMACECGHEIREHQYKLK
jgi:hypothetical protein